MNNISLIASVSNNWVIGKNNQMPWKQSDDLNRFKEITLNHIVIMGRKTYESIGGNLSGRINIVITKKDFHRLGCYVVKSIEEALETASKIITENMFDFLNYDEIFVIGGGEIYKQFLPLANKIYLTRVDCEIEGDTYFPKIGDDWNLVFNEHYEKDNRNQFNYNYEEYIKI